MAEAMDVAKADTQPARASQRLQVGHGNLDLVAVPMTHYPTVSGFEDALPYELVSRCAAWKAGSPQPTSPD